MLWEETIPIAVETDGDRFASVTLRDLQSGDETVVTAPYVLDGTELGDLLALGHVEHVIGAEGQNQTNELHRVIPRAAPARYCLCLDTPLLGTAGEAPITGFAAS